jgi:hypothetical protein
MNKPEKIVREDLSEALTYPIEAFISRDYAEAEPERLSGSRPGGSRKSPLSATTSPTTSATIRS